MMNYSARAAAKTALLLGVSTFAFAGFARAATGDAPQMVAQNSQMPENIVITGSLIRGEAPVGATLTSLGQMDFTTTGSVTVSDLLRSVPSVLSTSAAFSSRTGNVIRVAPVNIHYIGFIETLMLIDGMRVPLQSHDLSLHDPSMVPALGLNSVDVFATGASSTYGADAIAGVINLVLKRNYDGAETKIQYGDDGFGANGFQISQLWGRTWDKGGITLSYEYYNKQAILAKNIPWFTSDYAVYPGGPAFVNGNLSPYSASVPGTIIAPTANTALLPLSSTYSGNKMPTNFPSFSVPTCSTCFQVPSNAGPNTVLNYGTLTAGNNDLDAQRVPNNLADAAPSVQRHGFTATVDQELWSGIRFSASGVYSRRYGNQILPEVPSTTLWNVPTTNPYYPTNVPQQYVCSVPTTSSGACTGTASLQSVPLSVAYDIQDAELQRQQPFTETDIFATGRLEFDLPHGWLAHVSAAVADNNSHVDSIGNQNTNMIQVALQGNISSTNSAGAFQTFTKYQNGGTVTTTIQRPANVPALNVLCNSLVYSNCNSPATLAFIEGPSDGATIRQGIIRTYQYQAGVEGALFDLPGGTARLALGGDYYDELYTYKLTDYAGGVTVFNPVLQTSYNPGTSWALYGEALIPIVGDSNAMPGVRKLTLTVSGRYDDLTGIKSGTTTNPAIKAEWEIIDGVSIFGNWNTGFRAPTVAEQGNGNRRLTTPSGTVLPGSVANPVTEGSTFCPAALSALAGNATVPLPNCTGQSIASGGLMFSGTPVGGLSAVGLDSRPSNYQLLPENSTSWSVGTKFAPTQVPGLSSTFTYFNVRVANLIANPGNDATLFSDAYNQNNPSLLKYATLVTESRFGTLGNVTGNANSAAWQSIVSNYFQLQGVFTGTETLAAAPTKVTFFIDGASDNAGTLLEDGVDFSINYVRDFDALGIWNVGVTGTWYNTYKQCDATGNNCVSALNTNLNENNNPPPLRYNLRGQLGWTNNAISATMFVNYQPSFQDESNVTTTSGIPTSLYDPANPKAGLGRVASFTTFDMSLGYDFGDTPSNDYLKGISLQFNMANIFDTPPPASIGNSNGANTTSWAFFDTSHSNPYGRTWNIVLTKKW